MSNEFEAPGRTFGKGSNPLWNYLHKNDSTNDAQSFYSRGNAYTNNYYELVILTKASNTDTIGFDEVTQKTFAT